MPTAMITEEQWQKLMTPAVNSVQLNLGDFSYAA